MSEQFLAAVKEGNVEEVSSLIEAGANVNTTGKDRRTPLHFAVENGHVEIINTLLKVKGIDINVSDQEYGRTPLHFAVENDHVEIIVKLLIEKGADVDASDQDRRTPLHLTVKRNYKETIITLMGEGADINRLVFIENNESYEIIIRYIAKLEAAGLYISPSLVEGKEIFLDTSHNRFSNYLQHSRNCKKEVQEIEKENKLLHDFLKESDIGKLVSIFEENESESNRLNNQEGLKKHYPEYAYILISKTSEVKKVIFLHNHKPLIDVLSTNWKKDFQKMSFVGIENFFMSRKRDHFNLQQEIVTLIDCLNFEDVKERHIPTLKVKTLAKIINNQDVNSNLEYQSTEQIQGASQSLHYKNT